MSSVLDAVALAVAVGAVLIALAVAVVAGVRTAVGVLLELLLAAGLLRLAADPDWDRIALTAVIIGLRHLISASLKVSAHPGASRRDSSAAAPGTGASAVTG
ncbi:DUF1622 domain-containing protein [Georgenia sp. 10Sc9-8]|uniref:DUF1622 domain-containing protein n=1 Tax=Georgenia halotolerans TaxID=3028317 RepID=A0ABT5TWW0_9MICO|nr:DUF1622 domain-containing protein [Georgenia halotolerans]